MICETPSPSQRSLSSLVELLQQRASWQPTQRAYTFLLEGDLEEAHLTYAALDQQARIVAAHLQQFVSPGDRVLLAYPQGLAFIAAFFGCLYAGAIAIPISPPRRSQDLARLKSITTDSGAEIALTTAQFAKILQQRVGKAPSIERLRWIETDRLSKADVNDWQPPLQSQRQPLALLQYTSGSTGAPKGVMVSHGNLLHNLESITKAHRTSPKSIAVNWLPNFHDMGLVDGILHPLYAGFLSVMMSPAAFTQKPIRWLQAISNYGATYSGGPNFAYERCLQTITPDQKETLDLSSWECAYVGAQPVRQQTLEAFSTQFSTCGFQSQSFYPCYGLAEATLMVTSGKLGHKPTYRTVQADQLRRDRFVEATDTLTDIATNTPGSSQVKKQPIQQPIQQPIKQLVGCGYPHLDTQVIIVDPETCLACEPDKIGEIWVAGSGVAQGYWQQADVSQKVFGAHLADTQAGPFLRTGDLGIFQGGELFITGRRKNIIIIQGRNYYPQDIEATVAQAHLALQPDGGAAFSIEVDGIEQLVVVQEIRRSHLRSYSADEVNSAIAQCIFEYHELPLYAVALLKSASLPKTSSGKIQRHICRDRFLEKRLNVVAEKVFRTQRGFSESSQEETNFSSVAFNQGAIREKTATEKTATEKTAAERIMNEASIQNWLIVHLAELTQLDPDDIDPEEPFAQYGLDSSITASLTEELADWMGCELELTLLWEYPNIEALSQFLMSDLSASTR